MASAAQATASAPGRAIGASTCPSARQQRRPLGCDQQVLLDVEIVEQLDRLEGPRHSAPRQPVRRVTGDVHAIETHVSARGAVRAHEPVDQ